MAMAVEWTVVLQAELHRQTVGEGLAMQHKPPLRADACMALVAHGPSAHDYTAHSAVRAQPTWCSLCARSRITSSVLAWMTSPAASACKSKSVSCTGHQPCANPKWQGPS